MLQEERLIKITGHLKEEGSDNYANIADLLGVSQGTVRKDLAELDKRGLVKLVRGGAAYVKNNLTRSQLDKRSMINREEKKELVQELRRFVKNGQAIAINGGTTSIEAAKFLVKNYSELAIVTNNLTAVDILKEKKSFQIVVTGGIYHDRENTVIGKHRSFRKRQHYSPDGSGNSNQLQETDGHHKRLGHCEDHVPQGRHPAYCAGRAAGS